MDPQSSRSCSKAAPAQKARTQHQWTDSERLPRSRPTGKWETRWGALAEDSSANSRGVPLSTGVSESRRSKREAEKVAMEQCRLGGGKACRVTATYHNQCIAVADPKPLSQGGTGGKSSIYSAGTVDQARGLALKGCSVAENSGCSITYSACSMSEFKAF